MAKRFIDNITFQLVRATLCVFVFLPLTAFLLTAVTVGTVIPPLQEYIGMICYPIVKEAGALAFKYNL